MKRKSTSVMITESAIMLAFSTVLSMVKVVDMPYGGSVTAASMLPLIIIAYRYGTAWGLFSSLAAALLQLFLGMNNIMYATSLMAAIAIIMLDYIVAFTAMGLGGVFRKVCKTQSTALVAGSALVCGIRYICHVISGCTVWAGVSIPDADGLIFSIGYNAVYMVPETIITLVAAYYLGQMLDFRKEVIVRLPEQGTSRMDSLIGGLILAGTAIFDTIYLFSTTQVENAAGDVVFDITGIANANWVLVGILTAGALITYFLPQAKRSFSVLGTAVLFDAVTIIAALVSGGTMDILLMASVSAVAIVLALLLWKQFKPAIAASALLFNAIYLYNIYAGGEAPAAMDWVMVALALVCAAIAWFAFARYNKKAQV